MNLQGQSRPLGQRGSWPVAQYGDPGLRTLAFEEMVFADGAEPQYAHQETGNSVWIVKNDDHPCRSTLRFEAARAEDSGHDWAMWWPRRCASSLAVPRCCPKTTAAACTRTTWPPPPPSGAHPCRRQDVMMAALSNMESPGQPAALRAGLGPRSAGGPKKAPISFPAGRSRPGTRGSCADDLLSGGGLVSGTSRRHLSGRRRRGCWPLPSF